MTATAKRLIRSAALMFSAGCAAHYVWVPPRLSLTDYRLLDLRSDSAYAAYHIPGAERVSMHRVLRNRPN